LWWGGCVAEEGRTIYFPTALRKAKSFSLNKHYIVTQASRSASNAIAYKIYIAVDSKAQGSAFLHEGLV
jgi:hypothetical protein